MAPAPPILPILLLFLAAIRGVSSSPAVFFSLERSPDTCDADTIIQGSNTFIQTAATDTCVLNINNDLLALYESNPLGIIPKARVSAELWVYTSPETESVLLELGNCSYNNPLLSLRYASQTFQLLYRDQSSTTIPGPATFPLASFGSTLSAYWLDGGNTRLFFIGLSIWPNQTWTMVLGDKCSCTWASASAAASPARGALTSIPFSLADRLLLFDDAICVSTGTIPWLVLRDLAGVQVSTMAEWFTSQAIPDLVPVVASTLTFSFAEGSITGEIALPVASPTLTFTIQSLPTGATLYDGADPVTDVGWVVSSTLTYHPTDLSAFTIRDSAQPCIAEATHGSFLVKASNGLCAESCNTYPVINVSVCLWDVADAPYLAVANESDIRYSVTRFFTVQPGDADDAYAEHGLDSLTYSSSRMMDLCSVDPLGSARMRWVDSVIGMFGSIYLTSGGGTTCTETLAPANTSIAPPFDFCYRSNLGGVWGVDNFTLTLTDISGLESEVETLYMEVINPLEPCANVTLTNATVQESSCTSRGAEGASAILAYPTGKDWSNASTSFVIEILTLPTHGILYWNDSALTSLPALVTGTLTYVPEATYFNRVGTASFADGVGGGIGTCTLAVAPGCPDTFTYHLIRASDGLVSEEIGTYNFYVESVFTQDSLTISVPSTKTMTAGETSAFAEGFMTIIDLDDELYPVGLYVYTSKGDFVLGTTGAGVTVYAGCPFSSCPSFKVYGKPVYVSAFANNVTVVFDDDVTMVEGRDAIKYEAYKPSPAGVTSGNAQATFAGAPLLVAYSYWINDPEPATPTTPIVASLDLLYLFLGLALVAAFFVFYACFFGCVKRLFILAGYGVKAGVAVGGVAVGAAGSAGRLAASRLSTASASASAPGSEAGAPAPPPPKGKSGGFFRSLFGGRRDAATAGGWQDRSTGYTYNEPPMSQSFAETRALRQRYRTAYPE